VRILVTGAAGFIGSHLCEQLLAEGHEVLGIDSFVDYYPRHVKEANLRAIGDHPHFAFAELDLRTSPLDEALDGVDAVVNEAAMAGLMRSWSDLETYMGCNVLGLERLITAAASAGVTRFVQASTSSVYGREAVGDESQPVSPVSPYGVSKLAAEHLLLAHVEASGFPAIILRYFSVYGPRQRPEMAYHLFIDAMLRGEPITVYGDGLQSRSNTYVADCVRATIDALGKAKVGEIFNVGGGEEITLRRAIELIADAAGTTPSIRYAEARPGDQLRTWASTEKARAEFGYRPTVSAATGLRAQVQWQSELLAREGAKGRVRRRSDGSPIQG
jgi:nucleoside-diphosphate-sugar epimerase